jgi:hypothetical protein
VQAVALVRLLALTQSFQSLRGEFMIRRTMLALCCAAGVSAATAATDAHAQQAFGRQWGRSYNTQDWERFYHYPYVYYPQNFWSADYYRSSESLYYRYPPEMRVPVYNRNWQNYYPQSRRYHYGHHFILDTF